ncbi:MAG: hypothetical protein WD646_11260 [Actinomycetota bacterium]
MDTDAQRRARQRAIRADLSQAYTDEEASPPEWVDLLSRVRADTTELTETVAHQVKSFVAEPDIRAALARRETAAKRIRSETEKLNRTIARLNLIAPHPRFTRAAVDIDELLQPLFRSERRPNSS